jgi:hypothetical protein
MEDNMSTFSKAVKHKSKLRLAIWGVSGSGKTYSSLAIAKGMGGKVGVIDSEHGSASKYASIFDFDVIEMSKPYSIDKYIEYIKLAEQNKYDILIIDSITHAWQELLEEMDKLAETKYKGNSFRAWGEGTPKQKLLIETINSYKGHIIVTMRSNTEWVMTQNQKGQMQPKRVGTKVDQGKNIEYEFDMLIEMSDNHSGEILKDRTQKFQDKIINKPGIDFGKELIEWLNEGEDKKPEPKAVDQSKVPGQDILIKDFFAKLPDPVKEYSKKYKLTAKELYDLCNKHNWCVASIDAAVTMLQEQNNDNN